MVAEPVEAWSLRSLSLSKCRSVEVPKRILYTNNCFTPIYARMKNYWRSIDEAKTGIVLDDQAVEAGHKKELLGIFNSEVASSHASRRDFLKLLGFSVTSAAITASCERPVEKAIPYLIAPADIIPGKSNYYASAIYDGWEFASVVVKVRDGRPIKMEGNAFDPLCPGGTTARVQASILGLYDNARYQSPMANGKPVSWAEADKTIMEALAKSETEGRKIVLLSSSIISPSAVKLIEQFKARYPGFEVVQYDCISASATIEANEALTGKAVVPYYNIDKAKVLVSIQADFLGSWLMPSAFTYQYALRRKVSEDNPEMLRHIQFETAMSLSGSNADMRVPVKPSDELAVAAALYNSVARAKGLPSVYTVEVMAEWNIDAIAAELAEAGPAGLIISSSDDVRVQKIVVAINQLLGNTGGTVDYSRDIRVRQAMDSALANLIAELEAGKVGVLLLNNVNPAYDYFDSKRFAEALKKAGTSVSFAGSLQETASLCSLICPDSHPLERWGDFEPVAGQFYLAQPCIQTIFDTRQWESCLLTWCGQSADFHAFVRDYWERSMVNRFESAEAGTWPQWLQRGYMAGKPQVQANSFKAPEFVKIPARSKAIEVIMVAGTMGNGIYANNPWLQELPDPISKVTWTNVASIAPGLADRLSVQTGDIVNVGSLELPAYVQPGQAADTITISLGYGRTMCGKAGENIGVNAYSLLSVADNAIKYAFAVTNIAKTDKHTELALTQTHNSMEGRPIIRETTLAEYKQRADAGNELHEEFEKKHLTLYPEHKYDGYHWGLAVDLNACTGCSACMVACQVENNIPVVGPEQVRNRRSMHWVRVDRYFAGTPENPEVLFQPVMCQHCDNAPCENVCPVSATNHSNEGLNQMAYNRCIGTKYCINNCPYRVRRFNWFKYVNNSAFDYNQNSDLERLVLNPDVVVRERGVVEKCSFCVQRIQESKLTAKLEDRPVRDGEIQPACVQACPAKALVFGNLNDPDSQVSQAFANKRNYHCSKNYIRCPRWVTLPRCVIPKNTDIYV